MSCKEPIGSGTLAEAPVFGHPREWAIDNTLDLPHTYMSKTDAKLAEQMADSMRTPLKTGDSRRHHYIPQFYLRRFAKGDVLARVALDNPRQHLIAKVNNLAVIKDFYTSLDTDPQIGETVSTERLLSRIDDDAVMPLKCLAAGLIFTQRQPERFNLSLWLAVLSVRGPSQRRLWEALTDFYHKAQMAYSDLDETKLSRREFHREMKERVKWLKNVEVVAHQNEFIRTMLTVSQEMALFIHSRRWVLLKYTKPGLLLPDNPVVNLYDDAEPLWKGTTDSHKPKCVPIDRSTALIMHSNPATPEKCSIDPQNIRIEYLNQVLVDQAMQEVYCHPEDLKYLKKLRLPDSRDRPLLQVRGEDYIGGTVDGVNAPAKRKRHRRYKKSEETLP